jgi:tetratricopeptide (TPR) repeat protein
VPELYDLEGDPGETHNLASERPEIVADLAPLLAEAGRRGQRAEAPLDEEAREALESLGYVTGSAPARNDRPDPKRMIQVQNLLEQAQALYSADRRDECLAVLRAALARDPRNKDVHQLFGIVHAASGRLGEAADSFLQCLELPPHQNDRIPRFELASAYIRMGRPEQAIPHLERILADGDPDAPTWHNLGMAWSQLGRRDQAELAWKRALELDPGYELTLRALGRPPPGR